MKKIKVSFDNWIQLLGMLGVLVGHSIEKDSQLNLTPIVIKAFGFLLTTKRYPITSFQTLPWQMANGATFRWNGWLRVL